MTEAETGYTPINAQTAWHLARFIDVRSVSLDPVLMRRDWLAAYTSSHSSIVYRQPH